MLGVAVAVAVPPYAEKVEVPAYGKAGTGDFPKIDEMDMDIGMLVDDAPNIWFSNCCECCQEDVPPDDPIIALAVVVAFSLAAFI